MKRLRVIDLVYLLSILSLSCLGSCSPDFGCKLFTEQQRSSILKNTRKRSKKNPSKYFVEVFANRVDNFEVFKNFSIGINTFFKKAVQIDFYCLNKTLTKENHFDRADIFTYFNGKVEKQKNITYINSEFLDRFFKHFNLTKHLEAKLGQIKAQFLQLQTQTDTLANSRKNFNEKILALEKGINVQETDNTNEKYSSMLLQIDSLAKGMKFNSKLSKKIALKEEPKRFLYNVEFAQFNYGVDNEEKLSDEFQVYFTQVTTNRGLRLFLVIFCVFILTGLCIFGVKMSIDYATIHKQELNKLKESRIKYLIEEDPVLNKYLFAKEV